MEVFLFPSSHDRLQKGTAIRWASSKILKLWKGFEATIILMEVKNVSPNTPDAFNYKY